MPREKFKQKPFYYKALSILLRITSSIVIMLVIVFAIRFLFETPLYRMLDGITIGGLILMVLILFTMVCFILAWFKSIRWGIASMLMIITYTVIDSFEHSTYTASAINYIVASIALLFIVQGVLKKRIEYDRMVDILGPSVSDYDGPDLTNLHL